MAKICGECTLCCKLMGIKELEKAPCEWCPHCDVGRGCGIYADRPSECREFECLWLLDESWPAELRPDRCGVVMSSTLDGKRLVANVDPHRPDAYARGFMGMLLRAASQQQDVIIVIADKRKAMTTPDRKDELFRIIREERGD